MNSNDMVARVLRSPLHSLLSGTTLLLTVMGRKSGRSITMPVDYAQAGDTLWVISHATRTWWRNLIGGAPVSVLLRGQMRQGQGHATAGSGPATAQALQRFLAIRPTWASRFSIHRTTDGGFDATDLERVATERVVVEIKLTA